MQLNVEKSKQDVSRECPSSAKPRAYPPARRPGPAGSERRGKVHANANSRHDHQISVSVFET
jgi:hypothetical protein